VSLAQAGIRALTLVNRTPERASHLADLVAAQAPDCAVRVAALRPGWEPEVGAGPHLLVNTTSVGLAPADPPLFDYRALAPPLSVVDLIYNPAETPLLHAARARGCRAGNGLGMLLHQGALAFARWTGRPAPLQAMREALQRAMPGHFA
jgi:shikimate dehydrogenase